ncbi:MAG: hypothetical protein JNL71_01055 [Rhodospirillales bacterium]|nr:hypothetical protein [Rhodospirillales bacterium]
MSVSLLNGLDNYGNLAELFGGNEASRPDPNLDLLSPEANSTDPNAAGARAQTASGITATAGGDFGGNAGGGYSGGFSRNNFPPPPSGSGRGQLLDIAA